MAQREGTEEPALRVIFAANVRSYRKELGRSQERLAYEAGLSKETIRLVELGRTGAGRDLYLETIGKIADALGVKAWKLLQWDPETTRAYLNGQAPRLRLLAAVN